MPLVDAERNLLADTEAGRITHLSLHTSNPGTTGASEASGSGYARKPVTWSASASGTAVSAEVTFDVGIATYTHFGAWSALTGGTFRGGNPLSVTTQMTGVGQIKLTVTIPVTAS